MGIAFFVLATGSTSIIDFNVINQTFFSISIIFFLIVALFIMAVLPVHRWSEQTLLAKNTELLSYIVLINRVVLGFTFIVLLKRFLRECEPITQNIILNGVIVLVTLSALYTNISLLYHKKLRKLVMYSLLCNTNYLLLMIFINNGEISEKKIIFSLIMAGVAFVGTRLTLDIVGLGKNQDEAKLLSGLFQSNPLQASILIIFLLSLAGIPAFAGFSSRFLIMTSFFKENLFWSSLFLLFSMSIGLAAHLKLIIFIINPCFDKRMRPIEMNLRTMSIQLLFAVMIIFGGLAPGILLSLI